MQIIKLDPNTLLANLDKAKYKLNETNNFYPIFSYRGKEECNYNGARLIARPSLGSVEAPAAWEWFFAVYESVNTAVKSSISRNRKLNEFENTFIDLYSMYVSSVSGVNHIREDVGEVEPFLHNLNYVGEKSFNQLLENYCDIIRKKDIKGGKNLSLFTKAFLTGLADWCTKQKGRFPTLEDLIGDVHLQVDGIMVNGFSYKKTDEASSQLTIDPYSWEDLVAVEEGVEFIQQMISYVLCYKPEHKINPKLEDITWQILLYGDPGTGKTSILQAAITQLTKDCGELGIPFRTEQYSNSDKNEYFGKSPKILKQKIERAKDPSGIGCFFSEDFDLVFSSRKDMDSSKANEDILNEMMNQMQGAGVTYFGNSLMLFTSNFSEHSDAALYSRLHPIEIKGPRSSAEFSKLFIIKAKRGLKEGYISISKQDLERIGEFCESRDFRGRNLAKVVKRANGCAHNKKVPLAVCKLPLQELEKVLREKYTTKVTFLVISSLLEQEAQAIEHYKKSEYMGRLQERVQFHDIEKKAKKIVYDNESP